MIKNVEGLWKAQERKTLVRIHKSRVTESGIVVHMEFLKGRATFIYGRKLDVVLLKSVLPKRSFAIRMTDLRPMGPEWKATVYVVDIEGFKDAFTVADSALSEVVSWEELEDED